MYPHKILSFMLLLLLFVSSCKAQNSSPSALIDHKRPKIVVPSGSDEHGMFRCSMIDRNGDLWFGTTLFGRLYRFNGKSFITFSKEDGLTCSSIYSIAEDNAGNIWLGTNKGLFRGINGKFSLVSIPGIKVGHAPSMTTILGTGNRNASVPDQEAVYAIVSDKKGNLWLGTENFGLWKYDGKSFTNIVYINNGWKIIPSDSTQYYTVPHSGLIQFILEDKAGNIWFSTAGAATPSFNCFDGISIREVKVANLSSVHIFYMIQDTAGNLWLATRDNGVYRYNGHTFINFNEKDGLLDNTSCLLQDKSGSIWIGSVGKMKDNGGLVTRYNGKAFTPFPLNTLSNTGIWTMIEDRSGNIWIGTKEMGLYRYDGKSLVSFTEHVGRQ
ncbi:ligand-binding sensor domain-containing protein [Flavipsychrobacter stenotrophus]|nr:two-component regulator propeller domain-containing protein [Flavipsychrobacter stenotrophus]